jgi:glutamine amidotransferase
MCRILSYLGKPIVIEELLYKPDNSFIKQSYHPIFMSHLLNLAGFGLAAWDFTSNKPQLPYLYKSDLLPFYDENLRNLSSKISPHCMLAHLRGVSYSPQQVVSNQNVHPFIFDNVNIALAHNGALDKFIDMKYDLLDYINPEYQKKIQGTTDSEWIYAVFLSRLQPKSSAYTEHEIFSAINETFKIIEKIRLKHNINISSPVNLFITNGEFIAATRFVFDYGWTDKATMLTTHASYHSLWYTYGESYGFYDNEYRMKSGKTKSSIIIASEPLTKDVTTWVEVPEYTMIYANIAQGEVKIVSQDIDL